MIRPFTRFLAVTAAAGVMFVAGTHANAVRSERGPARYVLHNGVASPDHVVFRHCYAEDDYGAGLDIVAYDDARLVLRCHNH